MAVFSICILMFMVYSIRTKITKYIGNILHISNLFKGHVELTVVEPKSENISRLRYYALNLHSEKESSCSVVNLSRGMRMYDIIRLYSNQSSF